VGRPVKEDRSIHWVWGRESLLSRLRSPAGFSKRKEVPRLHTGGLEVKQTGIGNRPPIEGCTIAGPYARAVALV
jgi:hypothetical protein